MAIYDYQIAAGHDNAAGLTNIEAITPSGDQAFYPPQVWGSYDPGQFRTRTDGTLYVAGYPSVQWTWRWFTRAQFAYLQDTYCSGGYSGKVTVRTRTEDDGTYANYNAVLVLSKLSESEQNFTIIEGYTATFTRLESV